MIGNVHWGKRKHLEANLARQTRFGAQSNDYMRFSQASGFALCVFALALCAAIGARGARAQGGASVEPGQSFTAKVVSVTDGDTYDVRRSSGGVVTIRLWGIDAPESGQPYGQDATAAARRYIGGKSVRVSVEETGRYGRSVARVRAEGGSLGQMLARDGLGWHYDEYAPNATELARLERQARNAGRGLWSQANPTPPWEWRDRNAGQPADDRNCSDFDTQLEA